MRVLLALLLLISSTAMAQIKGVVTDSISGNTLVGVHVFLDDQIAGTTDVNGRYSLTADTNGSHQLKFQYISFKTKTVTVQVAQGKALVDVALAADSKTMGTYVVSASKYKQRIEELVVSMEVISPKLIENKNTVELQTAVDQVPGVKVDDGQVSIRGGSGFTYGAGSRVLVMVDDLPMLAGDAGDVKWNYLPVENLEQVEIIKGASSVLYGSSALNGVINIRTAPVDSTLTKINVFQGMYGDPVRTDSTGSYRDSTGNRAKPLKWWDNENPTFTGVNFFHTRKWKKLDMIVGGNFFSDQGYREGVGEQRGRLNTNLKYHLKRAEIGLNQNFMAADLSSFLLWMDADSGAYRPYGGMDPATTTVSSLRLYRYNIDPYINYYAKNGDKHSLRNRYFMTVNEGDSALSSTSHLVYNEYQYQKTFSSTSSLSLGLVNTYAKVVSNLYGDHHSNNSAIYGQYDKKFKRLKLSVGARGERIQLDDETIKTDINLPGGIQFSDTNTVWTDTLQLAQQAAVRPVIRLGLNYEVTKATFIRASYGQGYRAPSVAEKFINTSIGNLKLFANPDLLPETGWSAELGIKQGFKLGNWKGFIDIAGFWQEYSDMMEFSFGQYIPDTIEFVTIEDYINYSGFKAVNVGKSRITGVDIGGAISGKVRDFELTMFGGYTYTNPVILGADSAYAATLSDSVSQMLKYRFYHMVRADIQVNYKAFGLGLSCRYNSNVVNIDKSFESPLISNWEFTRILPGLAEYRERNNKGATVFDARFLVKVSTESTISLICDNLFNVEYMGRPGDMRPPRTLTLRYSHVF